MMQCDIKFDIIYFCEHLQKDSIMLKSILYLCYMQKKKSYLSQCSDQSIYIYILQGLEKNTETPREMHAFNVKVDSRQVSR